MKRTSYVLLTVLSLLAIVACGDTGEDLAATATSLASAADASEQVAEVESEISELTSEIQSSEAAADLEDAWTELQSEMTATLAAVESNGSVDAASLNQELEQFQSELDALGDRVGDDLRESWSSLRSMVEELTA